MEKNLGNDSRGKFRAYGQAAKAYFVQDGMTLEEISAELDVSTRTLSKWKREYDWDGARRSYLQLGSPEERLKELILRRLETGEGFTYHDINAIRVLERMLKEGKYLQSYMEMRREAEVGILKHQGTAVMMTAQLAEAYGTDIKRISENYKRNQERYIEGRDYIHVDGDDLKRFLKQNEIEIEHLHSANCGMQNLAKVRHLYLWTRRGALLHAKSLNTDQAWDVYNRLVDTYFMAESVFLQKALDRRNA